MPEYRTIARPVEAIPWIATADGTAAVIAWVDRFGGFTKHLRRMPTDTSTRYVDRSGRMVDERLIAYDDIMQPAGAIVYPGDWLVREAGHFHALSDGAFHARYEEVPV